MIWSKHGSFFWTQIIKLKPLFDWSTRWIIGDGRGISYWFDKWGAGVLALLRSRQVNMRQSLRTTIQRQEPTFEVVIDITE